jgi:hypothetical protein
VTGRIMGAVADSGRVLILAVIAAAGSFTHIRQTADEHGQHGWMSWAVAVCIDLTCVMAARERQRDKRTGRTGRALSWPTTVLCGGIVLSLAANLAQAESTVWGWLSAATPAGAFLVAVSMLERRASANRHAVRHEWPKASPSPAPVPMAVPPSFGKQPPVPDPSPDAVPASSPTQPAAQSSYPALVAVHHHQQHDQDDQDGQDGQDAARAPSPPASAGPAPALLDFARRTAAEHQHRHGRPITRDALRARLGVSNQLASQLLRHIRTEPAQGK